MTCPPLRSTPTKFTASASVQLNNLDFTFLEFFLRIRHQYPSNQTPPFAFVVNTDPSDQPGAHWVAVYKASRTAKLEFFDSFGLPLSLYPSLTHLIPPSPSGYEYNHHSFQSLTSRVCGFYSLAYIYLRANHWSRTHISRTLSTALPNSDSYVVKLIYRLRDLFQIISPCTSTCSCQSCKLRCHFC